MSPTVSLVQFTQWFVDITWMYKDSHTHTNIYTCKYIFYIYKVVGVKNFDAEPAWKQQNVSFLVPRLQFPKRPRSVLQKIKHNFRAAHLKAERPSVCVCVCVCVRPGRKCTLYICV